MFPKQFFHFPLYPGVSQKVFPGKGLRALLYIEYQAFIHSPLVTLIILNVLNDILILIETYKTPFIAIY
jgi:hypothetical protein